MWFTIPRKQIIGISISDTAMTLSHVTHHADNAPIIIQHHPLLAGELIDGVPFQAQRLADYITDFAKTYNLIRPYLAYALHDEYATPSIVMEPPTENNSQSVYMCHQLEELAYYMVQLRREHIMKYQLLSHLASLHCAVVTTQTSSCLTDLTLHSTNNKYATIEDLTNYIASQYPTTSDYTHAVARGLYLQGLQSI